MKHLFKLTMHDNTEQIIRTDLSLFELGNEIRAKTKIAVYNSMGEKSISVKSSDIHYIEHCRTQVW